MISDYIVFCIFEMTQNLDIARYEFLYRGKNICYISNVDKNKS